MKGQKPFWYGVLGGIILALYGVVATLQPIMFGRVYVAYGGVFIVMSLLWGWKVDNTIPDNYASSKRLLLLKPKEGECCVFCSYGLVYRPSKPMGSG